MPTYEKPAISDLGDLVTITQGSFNKVGSTADTFTAITGGVVIGSLTLAP